jgi:hypothetical protein
MEGQGCLLFSAPLEVTLPDLSTSTSGPSQVTSKYDLMAMLYAEGVKNRLLIGARTEDALERNAETDEVRRWGSILADGGGVASTA